MGETDASSSHDRVIHRAWSAKGATTQLIIVAWVCWTGCPTSHTNRFFDDNDYLEFQFSTNGGLDLRTEIYKQLINFSPFSCNTLII